MSLRKNGYALRFPCECVSIQRGYSDPWAGVTQNKLLSDGTKERVLNALARQPKTIALLAKELGLSQPTIHAHVNDLLNSELLCESSVREKSTRPKTITNPIFRWSKRRTARPLSRFAKRCPNDLPTFLNRNRLH